MDEKMIGISKLYCGAVEVGDVLRYGRRSRHLPSHLLQFSEDKKPVVVWNMTKRCNLKCIHCYASSGDERSTGELSTEEARLLIDDLANFGVPVLLFSGGEPLLRSDLIDLIAYARTKGIRTVISTNGTLISHEIADKLREVGLDYVGVSLDGLEETNDRLRGVAGAFEAALEGIRNCKKVGIKVGLRFTVSRLNINDVPAIFDLVDEEQIPRLCIYHLVYTGRGGHLMHQDLSHKETRALLDFIMDRTKELFDQGKEKEILTVDNHADGPYVYLRLLQENSPRAQEVLQLLKMNEGNSSGLGIGCISWDGEVYPDQFWRHMSVGNIREKPFSEIWSDENNTFLSQLRNRKQYLQGRCPSCRWLDICNGNFRARAEAATGNIWGEDPACYLTEEEIK
ncbi:MAG: 12,18-didecarboxysiroheme deacetylase [Syntrophales bacterium]|nr:12,18-didecarboxysiroheme deacetylase [Syntrophales bacterium]